KAVSVRCSGASDESARSDHASDGETNHMVAGGRDSRSESADDSSDEAKLEESRIRWLIRSPTPQSQPEASTREEVGEGFGIVSGTVSGFNGSPLPREPGRRARDPLQLHVGKESITDFRVDSGPP